MTLNLYNTLTRTKEVFNPIDANNVRMYVCGPTVYDYAHIGNARPIIVFDVLFRLLRHVYGKDHVTYVRNITDVDDKINARAAEEGVSIGEVTERTIKQFHEDISALGVLEPNVEPRATDHIKQMVSMIETLIAKGNAYEADGHVLFNVPSMPEYGKLSNRTLDEMIAGARVEVASYKKDPADFILWKPSSGNAPGWDSPWGNGRPGWHIECSAMSEQYLGKTFDIHGGGIDLQFPHHENEIAQSRCAHDTKAMANVWMHNGFLQVEGEKMSKSLGNFITINEQLNDFGGAVLRLNMLKTHYRQPIDWTKASLKESGRELDRWATLTSQCDQPDPIGVALVVEALCDELNTHGAITQLRKLYKKGNAGALLAATQFLGIQLSQEAIQGHRNKVMYVEAGEFKFSGGQVTLKAPHPEETKIETLITARNTARANKEWAESDRIRDELDVMGIVLKDSADGTTWEVKR